MEQNNQESSPYSRLSEFNTKLVHNPTTYRAGNDNTTVSLSNSSMVGSELQGWPIKKYIKDNLKAKAASFQLPRGKWQEFLRVLGISFFDSRFDSHPTIALSGNTEARCEPTNTFLDKCIELVEQLKVKNSDEVLSFFRNNEDCTESFAFIMDCISTHLGKLSDLKITFEYSPEEYGDSEKLTIMIAGDVSQDLNVKMMNVYKAFAENPEKFHHKLLAVLE